ncbi:hypothetical protein BABINDRAFT_163217 [Babjeviella inositovora NRRL Y-12698]|uniref:Membrane insertase YidC/Oxa/ALB C-terminal domain-containing protein n=1 Tax=Babjeviella inositovora NRRL Y-12698 TaxID=984486 RepID=A0A1E3QJJ3_9ASCO|nr:uncharacterized protein BABINDRAFT_163217 [Babjeviella inositovora NRRL Y-12698]ODQ77830.1 hypothetical protein BABINDRAFT_163217 [Babjeviella inositovora NRRL Y-12698]
MLRNCFRTTRALGLTRPGQIPALRSAGLAMRFNSTAPVSEIKTQLTAFDKVQEAAEAVGGMTSDQIGYLDSIGLAKSWVWPPDLIQNILECVHVYSGMPWWATIVATTIGLRLALFPLYIKSSDMMARMSKIKPQMDQLLVDIKEAKTTMEQQKVALRRKKLLQSEGIKQRFMMVPFLQLPLAIGFFTGLRHMANYPVQGFSDQGILWFTDLTAPDPYVALQVISAACFAGFVQLGGELGSNGQMKPFMKKIMTIMPILSIPLTMNLASAIIVYFFTNALFSITQTMLIKFKPFRKALGLAEFVPPPAVEAAKAKNQTFMESVRETFQEQKEKAEKKAERALLMKDQADANKKRVAQAKASSQYAQIINKPRQQAKK